MSFGAFRLRGADASIGRMGTPLTDAEPVSGPSEATRRAVLSDISRVLMPLARLYLGAGLGASEFNTAAKLAFVRVAGENTLYGNRMNISAIAAATGMTRRDVRALAAMVNESAGVRTRKFTHQRTTRVIHGWQTDPQFLDEEGSPAVLPIRGTGATFAALVERYGGDVPPISVLNELLRTEAVARNQADFVRLRKQSTRMRGYTVESITEVATRMRDLAKTLVGNIEQPNRPTYTGFQELGRLPPDVAMLFLAAFAERGALLIDSVERWGATHRRRRRVGSETPAAGLRRVGIGVYLVDEPASGDVPLPPSPKKARKGEPKRNQGA